MAHAHGHHELLQQRAKSPPQVALVVSVLLVCPLLVHLLVRRCIGTTPSTATARAREELLSKLPSPPRRLPVIGHLHLVGRLPHVSLRDLSSKHGRNGLMLLHLGAVPTLIVSSPSAAQAVLRTQDHIFASRATSPVTDILFYGSTDIVFSPYSEQWRQVKKIVSAHLLATKKVRSYSHAREHEVRLVVAKIREAATAGTAVDLSELLVSFVNDVLCHAVFGNFFREKGWNKLFQELVEVNSSLLGGFNLEDYFPVLVKLDIIKRMVCAKAHKVKKMWDDLLNTLIDDYASMPASKCDGDETYFIDVLLSLQQECKLTRDHTKALLELMRNPCLMNKLQAEVRNAIAKGKEMVTEDELDSLAYLKAVIKETLRLHMPAPLLVPHFSMADGNIEGYTIPSGTRAIVNSWALARDPSYWEKAEEFKPERFMEGGSATAIENKGNDFQYLPFGAGRRMCPGANFAIANIEVMLANLVYHFNWELPMELAKKGIDMTESFGVIVHRTKKLLLVPIVPQD
ncbi:unnamed protein product [Miscanthus lutarioriparius]|uniref:Uncharacterized protein n=1 Tax=Miscanthus lutarioriparius TaxID=422564 RepID=A0A811R889_9POAL|nr:unnamed protein product [Miscanthus lutarioriparius]